ncbi:hypothetical protein CBM2609_A110044 [Cupriavidus taiwanensis]|nr:hypothetical protein CBM2604_A90043 [Cupriavidus taiwanensis]SOZ23495.1 hypothetical protein CBM2609_A110044 [Cupriavidus taiwanensis]
MTGASSLVSLQFIHKTQDRQSRRRAFARPG